MAFASLRINEPGIVVDAEELCPRAFASKAEELASFAPGPLESTVASLGCLSSAMIGEF